jgi:creatinine amidohydrolase
VSSDEERTGIDRAYLFLLDVPTAGMNDGSVVLVDLSWMEIERRIENGTDTVVLPVGATEQHGPHLPLGTDTEIGRALAREIAERRPGTLVAPTVQVGCSDEHAGFPGTLSVRPSTLVALLRDVVNSLERHGFAYVVFLPSHGGNFAPVETAVAEIAPDLDDTALIPLTDGDERGDLMNEGLAEAGIDYEQDVIHAGAVETSLMLAIDEGSVRTDDAEPGPVEGVTLSQVVNQGFDAITENGVLGDPGRASCHAGNVILGKLAGTLVERIDDEIDSLDESST